MTIPAGFPWPSVYVIGGNSIYPILMVWEKAKEETQHIKKERVHTVFFKGTPAKYVIVRINPRGFIQTNIIRKTKLSASGQEVAVADTYCTIL